MNARDYAVKLLSIADRSERELKERLLKKGFGETETEQAINFCSEYGYIDDRRFAEHFVHDAVELKKWGSVRIRAELKRRGVEEDKFADLIESLDNEYNTLLAEMRRRFGQSDINDQKTKNRIFGYFSRRGYKTADILSAMGEESDCGGYIE